MVAVSEKCCTSRSNGDRDANSRAKGVANSRAKRHILIPVKGIVYSAVQILDDVVLREGSMMDVP
jgi:hypothetical protein